jgi:cytoskeletal protein CcmA (bactofilin family)
MWKKNPEEEAVSPNTSHATMPSTPPPTVRTTAPGAPAARVGQTLSLKGELVGNEDLVVDGELEGTVELGNSRLTVGGEGRVEADVHAREIIIEGTVRGKLRATDRLQITRSGNVMGELVAGRIIIEDGAYFKGSIDIQKPGEEAKGKGNASGESLRIAPTPLAAKDKLQ